MSVSGWNVVDIVIGVLGILATIIPLFAVWACARLPKKKLRRLEEIFDQTEDLFTTAHKDNLITDQKDIDEMLTILNIARTNIDKLRATVHSAQSIRQRARNWWNGICGTMSNLQTALNRLRVDLAKRSSDERRAQIARNLSGAAIRHFEDIGFPLPERPSLSSTPSSTAPTVSHAQEEHSNNLASPEVTPVLPSTNDIEDSVTVADEDTLRSPHIIDLQPTPDRHPTHHLITSDAHLQSLHRDTNHCKPKAGARDVSLLHPERRLHTPGYTRKTSRYRFVRRARPTVVHIYRYVFYGAHPTSGDGTPPSTLHDPESLLPRGVRYGANDANADDG